MLLGKIKTRCRHGYYLKNRERIIQKSNLYYKNNKVRRLLQISIWQSNNIDKKRKNALRYYYSHKDKIRAYQRTNEKSRQKYKKYRANKIINGGQHSLEDWRLLLKITGNMCVSDKNDHDGTIEKDHINAIVSGGNNDIYNLQPLCRRHNASKGRKTANYLYGHLYNNYYALDDINRNNMLNTNNRII